MSGANAIPLQQVRIKAVYIDRLEVTNARYYSFAHGNPAWQRESVDRRVADGHYMRQFTDGQVSNEQRSLPVTWVSWFAAKAFCEAQRKRLPTAWEWEKAARGTDGRVYPWGNKMENKLANFCDRRCPHFLREETWDDGFAGLAPVGSFPGGASPFGALDMSGNVSEWVNDWLDDSGEYQKHLPRVDPAGPIAGVVKADRGGSFMTSSNYGTELFRFGGGRPERTYMNIGFRCAMDAPGR
ncbi:MAG: SUMF1/EgtB/PvdO family nonheme iron enzyme [Acidobacteria bacterium]|nr:SUMF1/EgtB/PvdO family nonheme iron enzyme [Acidobacteriota bacterium]